MYAENDASLFPPKLTFETSLSPNKYVENHAPAKFSVCPGKPTESSCQVLVIFSRIFTNW